LVLAFALSQARTHFAAMDHSGPAGFAFERYGAAVLHALPLLPAGLASPSGRGPPGAFNASGTGGSAGSGGDGALPGGVVVLLTNEDVNQNSVKYVQQCHGVRRDVRVVSVPLITYLWWRPQQLRHHPGLAFPGVRRRRAAHQLQLQLQLQLPRSLTALQRTLTAHITAHYSPL